MLILKDLSDALETYQKFTSLDAYSELLPIKRLREHFLSLSSLTLNDKIPDDKLQLLNDELCLLSLYPKSHPAYFCTHPLQLKIHSEICEKKVVDFAKAINLPVLSVIDPSLQPIATTINSIDSLVTVNKYPLALKQPISTNHETDYKALLAELKLHHKLNNRFLVTATALFYENERLKGFVMPYFANGSLVHYFSFPRTRRSTNILKFSYHIALALQCLFRNRITHGDVKAQNCLVETTDNGATVKLCDFSHSRFFENKKISKQIALPTYVIAAPEIIKKLADQNLDSCPVESPKTCTCITTGVCTDKPEITMSLSQARKADIFSYGLLLYYLITLSDPWSIEAAAHCQQHTINLLSMYYRNKMRPDVKSYLLEKPERKATAQLMQMCWETEPADRPSVKALLEMPEFENLCTSKA